MARRNRRLTTACAGSVAAGLLASGGVLVDRAAGATPPGTAAPTAPRGVSAVPMGAYLDYGPAGVTRMQQLSQWLGGAELTVGHTYLPGDRWSNIEGSGLGFLEDWARWRRGADGRLFVLNVPMLDRNEERVPDWLVRWKLRAGAAGRFDHHFRALGQRLVSLGVPDTVVVLGWEMNGTTYAHRCGPDPRSWRAYWRRAVAALRSVPGQRFRFDFAPNRGRDAVPWTLCYPGDDVVDIVGMDSYDQAPGRTFEEQASAPYGLHDQVAFARAHNKQISYPEWGLFRNGDNPDYMRGMLEWIERHRPLYQTITDYCPHGVWQCDDNPKSSKVFHEMLAKPVTVPPVSPAPPVTPVPPVVPSPVTPGGSVAPGASGTATAPGVSGTAPVADPVAHPLWGPAGTAPVADPTPRRTPTASSVPPP
ncbi:glycoside hydrolase family 26 protein, partial [Streptomyces clavuligerus]